MGSDGEKGLHGALVSLAVSEDERALAHMQGGTQPCSTKCVKSDSLKSS